MPRCAGPERGIQAFDRQQEKTDNDVMERRRRGPRVTGDRNGSMMKTVLSLAGCVFAMVFAWSWTSEAQTRAADGPTYSSSGQLIRPADYREWVYLTSGLGMTYGPAQPAAGRPPLFDNVFVTREAYREFLRSGTWPDKTMFILEIRRADANVSINNGGQRRERWPRSKRRSRISSGSRRLGLFLVRQSAGARGRSRAASRHGVVLRVPSGQHGRRQHVRAVLSDAVRCREAPRDGQAHLRPDTKAVAMRRVGVMLRVVPVFGIIAASVRGPSAVQQLGDSRKGTGQAMPFAGGSRRLRVRVRDRPVCECPCIDHRRDARRAGDGMVCRNA